MPGYLRVVEDFLRFTWINESGVCTGGGVDDMQWRLDKDSLRWNVIAIENAPASEIAAFYETRPWQQAENR